MFYNIMNILIVIFIVAGCFSYYELTKPSSRGWGGLPLLIVSCFGVILLASIELIYWLVETYT